MLHRKVHTNDIIEAKLTLQMVIEARVFELLREEKDDAEETLRVFIRHRKMSLPLQAPQVALRQKGCGEGHIAAVPAATRHFRHKSHEPQARIGALNLFMDSLQRQFNFPGWIILVQIDHLHVI